MRLVSRYYDRIWTLPDRALVERHLSLTGGPLVDLGCATGRVLRFALEAGLPAIGIDDNPAMIAAGKRMLDPEFGTLVQFVMADYVTMPFAGSAGLITSMANTLAMLPTREACQSVLRNACKKLGPNGRMIICIANDNDVPDGERIQTIATDDGELRFRRFAVSDQARRIRVFTLDLEIGSEHEHLVFETRLIGRQEMQSDIAAAGLAVIELFGSLNEAPYDEASVHQIYVLERKP
jgi:SAM-dependent methyltransferase